MEIKWKSFEKRFFKQSSLLRIYVVVLWWFYVIFCSHLSVLSNLWSEIRVFWESKIYLKSAAKLLTRKYQMATDRCFQMRWCTSLLLKCLQNIRLSKLKVRKKAVNGVMCTRIIGKLYLIPVNTTAWRETKIFLTFKVESLQSLHFLLPSQEHGSTFKVFFALSKNPYFISFRGVYFFKLCIGSNASYIQVLPHSKVCQRQVCIGWIVTENSMPWGTLNSIIIQLWMYEKYFQGKESYNYCCRKWD